MKSPDSPDATGGARPVWVLAPLESVGPLRFGMSMDEAAIAGELRGHWERHPDERFVFAGANGGWLRRSNFRRRVWLPALAGHEARGWARLNRGCFFMIYAIRVRRGWWRTRYCGQ